MNGMNKHINTVKDEMKNEIMIVKEEMKTMKDDVKELKENITKILSLLERN
jgi:phage shock protein A